MFNWRLKLQRLFQVLGRHLTRALPGFLQNLRGFGSPHKQLAVTCQTLHKQLTTADNSFQTKDKAWKTYAKALLLAQRCDREELIQVIVKFDPLFGEQVPSSSFPAKRILSVLLKAEPLTAQALDAAWRLSRRLEDQSSRTEIQQLICVQSARIGDTNGLLVKLLKRRKQGCLAPAELQEILSKYIEHNSFDVSHPWKAFFSEFEDTELPQIHQVYALVERYEDAADLAEAARDYRSAIRYLMSVPGKETALRVLALAERVKDSDSLPQAHQNIASCFWEEGSYADALEHFQKAGNLERTSDCHQQLGQLERAIQLRPAIHPEWILDIRGAMENTVRAHLDRREFLEAVRLLRTVEQAWRNKSNELDISAEADRTQHLLSEVMRTVRASFEAQLQAIQGQSETEVLKQWSLLEEAAGNYLEAGLQAEKAQDYFAASLLFEKAGAFGQALIALDSASPNAPDPRKKAQLLEQGGDFFMAGLLYERMGETEQAISMYEQAKEYQRAAQLRRQQLGDNRAVFDDRFQELLTKAGRVEELAELCAGKAYETERSPEEKARLLRRIQELGTRNLVGSKWLNLVATELPSIEALDRRGFEEQAGQWLQAATREVLGDYIDAIGLDLGTSNSVVCLYNKKRGEPEVVEWHGRRQFPSVFAIDQVGRELVGVPISELLGKSPRAIVTKAKRQMGTDTKFKAGGQVYRPEEISARIINCARQLAREYLGKKIGEKISLRAAQVMGTSPPEDWITAYLEKHPPAIPLGNAVITVPAYFNDAQKQATRTAGVLADINVLRLIHEPTAACLAQRTRSSQNETILIADLGAGTFDLSIIEVEQSVFEVLEIEGDNALGSADLDDVLYSHFLEFVKVETGQDIASYRQAGTRLRQACEELKIELSSRSAWTIELPQFLNGSAIELTLTRDELERLAAPWIERIRATCKKINRKPSRILLIGGGAIMPAVRRGIREVFGQEPSSDLDPLTAVARGAILQAAILMGALQEAILLDVVPFSLGIKSYVAPGQFKFDSLIPKHTTIPSEKTQRYTTIEDSQTKVRIEVFQGESPVPEDNFKIGQFILEGIPLAKAGVPQIDVTFDIDSNCLLTVTARDAGTGNQCGIMIADSHLLTPAQAASLQARFRDSQTHQGYLTRLEKLAGELAQMLRETQRIDILELLARLQERLQYYEGHRERYLPSATDNNRLFEVYRNRDELEMKARLAQDRWDTLSRSSHTWLDGYGSLDWRSTEVGKLVEQLVEEGSSLLERTRSAAQEVTEVAATYTRWLSVIENLPINPEGNAEELAQHFLRLNRYSEAITHFERIDAPLSPLQVELGLEILARSRQREAYAALFLEHAQRLGVHSPDNARLNHSVRIYASSVVWIQVNLGGSAASGSGFVISPNEVATNRHVVINESTGQCVLPETVSVITKEGPLQVASIYLPTESADDVAILRLVTECASVTPLRLGFSELVEVGERILTVGFPAPGEGGFEENLYCNVGLVNRIRPSQLCTERVLEVSIPLQGGISGAPILNQLGEVVGLLSFSMERKRENSSGQIYSEQSFYAIPVEVLRRLRLNVL
jgi:molecular chaperone DnaK